jgi:hypothetical protein
VIPGRGRLVAVGVHLRRCPSPRKRKFPYEIVQSCFRPGLLSPIFRYQSCPFVKRGV